MPRALGHCARLERALLSVNKLSGPLPDNLGNLRETRELSLWGTDVVVDDEARYMLADTSIRLTTDDFQDSLLLEI